VFSAIFAAEGINTVTSIKSVNGWEVIAIPACREKQSSQEYLGL